jgi:hypothetical protein
VETEEMVGCMGKSNLGRRLSALPQATVNVAFGHQQIIVELFS